ncbi:hypothetical protein [Nannocystis pusilla]|uniref:hypothetical protein n=1 Tax=Nannocystis pusilla TaxID=889268 RepID=UPI003B798A08
MLRVFLVALGLSGCAHESIERASLPPADLEATQAAELGGHWTNLTRICVDPDGTVVERSTKRPSGDPILDLLYLDDVAKRRYPKQRSQKCRDIRFEQDFGLDRSEEGPRCRPARRPKRASWS